MIGDSVVVIDNISFRMFCLEHKRFFESVYFFRDYKELTWEHSFPYLFSFSKSMTDSKQLLWRTIGCLLVVFEYSVKQHKISVYTNPLVIPNFSDDVLYSYNLLFRLLNKINQTKTSMMSFCVTSTVDNIIPKDGKKIIDYSDFVFCCDDLIKLEGSKYRSRRSMINRFKRDNPTAIARVATAEDLAAITAVHNNWIKEYKARRGNNSIWDRSIFPNMLKNYLELDLRLIVVEINNRVEGFSIYSKHSLNSSIALNRCANNNISGLSEFLWYESLKLCYDLGEYENDGNGGSPEDGLYFYKMSHVPIFLLDKSMYNLNKKGQKILVSTFKKKGR